MAAAYVGEKHVEDFLDRVGTKYPEPRVVQSVRRRFWYRDDLDRAIGLSPSESNYGGRRDHEIEEWQRERARQAKLRRDRGSAGE